MSTEKNKIDKEGKIEITRPEDVKEKMLLSLKNGQEKGTTTFIPEWDKCWKWRKREFNIWTGYANEGKSEFIRFLCLLKVIKENWKFLFCAPEDYPPEEFFDSMIHTITGQSTDRDNPNCVSEENYLKAFDLIKDNFTFVYLKPPVNTVKGVLVEFEQLLQFEKYDAAIVDPLIKFARPKDLSERDDIYAGYITSIMTDFAREHDISLHLVMHQLTPKIGENSGLYNKPSMYTVKGGGSWSDGTDNILSIFRPNYAKDKLDTSVQIASQKIKKQKLVGIPQEIEIAFDRKSNRYIQKNGDALFDFEKWTGIRPKSHKLFN